MTSTRKPARSRKPAPPSPEPSENQQALDAWAERRYRATLPSGMEVVFRLPSLGEMAALGELPAELQELAIAEWTQPGISAYLAAAPYTELRDVARARESEPTEEETVEATGRSRLIAARIHALNRHVIAAALIAPEATPDDLKRMPYRDLEMLTILVNRGSGVDATGRHVGVVPLDTFQLVAQTHGAECDGAPACQACLEARREMALLQ